MPLGAKCGRAKYAQCPQCFSLAQRKSGFCSQIYGSVRFFFSYLCVGVRNIEFKVYSYYLYKMNLFSWVFFLQYSVFFTLKAAYIYCMAKKNQP